MARVEQAKTDRYANDWGHLIVPADFLSAAPFESVADFVRSAQGLVEAVEAG